MSAEPMTGAEAGMRRLLALDRADLFRHAETYFRHGGGTEPDVALVAVDGVHAVFKDYGAVDGWFARLLGPVLIAREAQALERLDGMAGVPSLYRRLGRYGVLMSYVPAEPLSRANAPPDAFEALDDLLADMHAHGVAHCDLRAPSNVLVAEDGRPYLVDFIARVHRGRSWNLPWNWIFRAFCCADRNALAKLKVRFAPSRATESERRRAEHRGWLARSIRAVGMGVRSLTRFFVRTGHR